MTNSTRMAGLLGPALIAISVTEWMNRDVLGMSPSLASHRYLYGTLQFVAGLAIVRAHNCWTRNWPVLITLVGWLTMLDGLFRMVAPLYVPKSEQSGTIAIVAALVFGVVLTFKSFGRRES